MEPAISLPFPGASSCPPGFVGICGQSVGVPSLSPGAAYAVQVPSPYQHETFTVMCLNVNGAMVTQITDTSGVTCSLLKCGAGDVRLCGVSVPVDGGTVMGSTVASSVPASMLIDPQNGEAPFTAKCVDDGNGSAVYQIGDDSKVSCNRFACPTAQISLCGAPVTIQGGAAMGAVLNLTMVPPFAPDPFTVQCVGSMGNAPAYQLTDGSAVTCNQTPVNGN